MVFFGIVFNRPRKFLNRSWKKIEYAFRFRLSCSFQSCDFQSDPRNPPTRPCYFFPDLKMELRDFEYHLRKFYEVQYYRVRFLYLLDRVSPRCQFGFPSGSLLMSPHLPACRKTCEIHDHIRFESIIVSRKLFRYISPPLWKRKCPKITGVTQWDSPGQFCQVGAVGLSYKLIPFPVSPKVTSLSVWLCLKSSSAVSASSSLQK